MSLMINSSKRTIASRFSPSRGGEEDEVWFSALSLLKFETKNICSDQTNDIKLSNVRYM